MSISSMEDVEQLMEETQEAVEKQREISDLISGQLTQVCVTKVLGPGWKQPDISVKVDRHDRFKKGCVYGNVFY
jgi:t-SNARE complex subunit (syntaxin)